MKIVKLMAMPEFPADGKRFVPLVTRICCHVCLQDQIHHLHAAGVRAVAFGGNMDWESSRSLMDEVNGRASWGKERARAGGKEVLLWKAFFLPERKPTHACPRLAAMIACSSPIICTSQYAGLACAPTPALTVGCVALCGAGA